jgi:hypothetical protein
MMIEHASFGCGKAARYCSLSKKNYLRPSAHVGIHRIARNNHRMTRSHFWRSNVRYSNPFSGVSQFTKWLLLYWNVSSSSWSIPSEQRTSPMTLHHNAAETTMRNSVEFTLLLIEPGLWRWRFQIGETPTTGKIKTNLRGLATRRVQAD